MQLQQLNTYSTTLCFGLLIPLGPISSKMVFIKMERSHAPSLELVFKELNHFGVIADLFRQIGGHSSRFVLFLKKLIPLKKFNI